MKILVLANKDIGLYKFRKELLKELIRQNNEVFFSVPNNEYVPKLKALGCKYIETPVDRRGTNPIKDLKLFLSYIRMIKRLRPEVVLTFTIKPIVYGGIACRITKTKYITSITGLGSSIYHKGILQKFILKLYKFAIKKSKCIFIQNKSSRQFFETRNILRTNSKLIPGSGVNLKEHCFEEYPKSDETVKFLFVGRIMKDKGINELFEAVKRTKRNFSNIEFNIVGFCEEDYSKQLKENEEAGLIRYHGLQEEVHSFIKSAHALILPSYHEGTANVLLEAAATGRPVLASSVPGCMETFEEGISGFSFEAKDVNSLVDAIVKFIELPYEQKKEMGVAGRKKMENEFNRQFVIDAYMNELNCLEEKRMDLYNKIINREEKISLIGLGYVGMPIAVAFARKADVVGFDTNISKVELYKNGMDPTKEVGDEEIRHTTVEFTSDETKLREAKFHIVAVPTPVNTDHTPDLTPVKEASRTVGRNLSKGSVVVYESTVYPGVTEDICIPILEKESGLKCGIDFKVGYSPERINPGDKVHRLETIVKIVSGIDEETLDTVAKVYELVVESGVHKAESIKVAEAAKVIENSQRDINIAFMNELSIIFNKMGIDTNAVLKAAKTKWNFLEFSPGLVGGHCIGVDPYYLTYKAEEMGYHSQIILSGRKINDDMGKYVAENTVKHMIKGDKKIKGATVAVLGITFKENCPDVRNTKVIDIINELKEYDIRIIVNDPIAEKEEVLNHYGIHLCALEEVHDVDAVILAVSHKEYISLTLDEIKHFYNDNKNVLIDVKGVIDREEANHNNFIYWRL